MSGRTITHAWFRTTEMFKDDSVIGISKAEWDDLDTCIDAALRRAKAEGMREAAKQARKGATLWSAGMKEREAAALDEFAVWLDARAAQIEQGE